MARRLRKLLFDAAKLAPLSRIYNAYDIVGDIAIIRNDGLTKSDTEEVADAVMNIHRNIKTILTQTGAVKGVHRLRKLECITGQDRTETVHRESGCVFRVDVEKCYFSPRLSHERMRIASQIQKDEVVFNMFAGVGCFSVIVAKHSPVKKVYSVDINPTAVRYMKENIRINGTYGKVVPLLGDSKEVAKNLSHSANRVLMPLPEKALGYLPYAAETLTEKGGWIHYYGFEHSNKNEDPLEEAESRVACRLRSMEANFTFKHARVIRTTGPNWYQVVLDILIN